MAVSGTKLDRDGLNKMLQAAKEGCFQCLFFYGLSRLARESVISMPLLKELVYVHKVRIISVTEGIDSNREGWEMSAGIHSIMAERYIADLGKSVFRGQEGTVLARLSVGDHCFGYDSVPVPGSESHRRGRNAKPRMTYVIDDTASPWVVRIFEWFVKERRSIRWITQELNRQGAPKDHRATTRDWHHQYVSKLLANPKYIGTWPWGQRKNNRNPLTGMVHQEDRPEHETDKWTRQMPDLRLIDDDTWKKAQKILEENRKRHAHHHKPDGEWAGSTSGNADNHPRHLLSRLIICQGHDAASGAPCGAFLNAGGTDGRYMLCPRHAKGLCECKTQLSRDLAEKLILDAISTRILSNDAWKNAILKETLAAWKKSSQRRPEETERLEKSLADNERKIQRLVDAIEDGTADPGVHHRLQERRREMDSKRKELEKLRKKTDMFDAEPTHEWIEAQLRKLSEILAGDNPAAALALRKLVGGAIPVWEIREPDRKRFYWRGKITIEMPQVIRTLGIPVLAKPETDQIQPGDDVSAPATTIDPIGDGSNSSTVEIIVDFREPSPMDAEADRAKELSDQGLLNAQVAAKIGCSRARVTELLQHWHKSRGLDMEDGRQRHSGIMRKQPAAANFDGLVKEARGLWDEGLADDQIAVRLACTLPRAIAAVDHSFRSQRHAVPNHEERRLTLLDRMVSLYDQNFLLCDIAGQVGLCSQAVRLLLRERIQQLGRTMIDGRSRRSKQQ